MPKSIHSFSIVVLLLILPLSIRSQDSLSAFHSSNWIFAEIVGNAKLLSTKVNVSIDFGQGKGGIFRDNRMVDDQGKAITFNSMVDAMNYMANDGWEFCQAYVVGEGGSLVYHWLMKIRATPDEKGELMPITKNQFRKAMKDKN
jgi:hypothetical protein